MAMILASNAPGFPEFAGAGVGIGGPLGLALKAGWPGYAGWPRADWRT
jgi:hypothetical protein